MSDPTKELKGSSGEGEPYDYIDRLRSGSSETTEFEIKITKTEKNQILKQLTTAKVKEKEEMDAVEGRKHTRSDTRMDRHHHEDSKLKRSQEVKSTPSDLRTSNPKPPTATTSLSPEKSPSSLPTKHLKARRKTPLDLPLPDPETDPTRKKTSVSRSRTAIDSKLEKQRSKGKILTLAMSSPREDDELEPDLYLSPTKIDHTLKNLVNSKISVFSPRSDSKDRDRSKSPYKKSISDMQIYSLSDPNSVSSDFEGPSYGTPPKLSKQSSEEEFHVPLTAKSYPINNYKLNSAIPLSLWALQNSGEDGPLSARREFSHPETETSESVGRGSSPSPSPLQRHSRSIPLVRQRARSLPRDQKRMMLQKKSSMTESKETIGSETSEDDLLVLNPKTNESIFMDKLVQRLNLHTFNQSSENEEFLDTVKDVLQRIVHEQEAHLDNVKSLVQNWIKPLNSKKKLSIEQISLFEHLFGFVEEICELEVEVNKMYHQNSKDFQMDVIVNAIDTTETSYMNYFKEFDVKVESYIQISALKGFKQWNANCQAKANNMLSTLLLEPLHFRLKFATLVQLLEKKNKDFEQLMILRNGLKRMGLLSELLSHHILELEAKIKVFEVQERIQTPLLLNLGSAYRLYVCEGRLDFKLEDRKRGYLFVMNDLFILCRTIPKRVDNVVYEYHDHITVRNLKVRSFWEEEDQPEPCLFLENPRCSLPPQLPFPVFLPSSSPKFKDIVENSVSAWKVELPYGEDMTFSPHRFERPDIYREDFYQFVHYNFAGSEFKEPDSILNHKDKAEKEYFVYSVLGDPAPGTHSYRALKTTKKGYEELILHVPEDEGKVVNGLLKAICLSASIAPEDEKNVFFITEPSFANEFVKFEEKHCQHLSAIKIGVVYCENGQVNPQEMLKNGGAEGSPVPGNFWDFLDGMGEKRNLSEWTGYKGDMRNNVGETYCTLWNQIEVIYHVAPMLNADEQRRLIGNDLVLIIFIGVNSTFDPQQISAFGQVPQVVAVVQPIDTKEGTRYRVAFITKGTIPYFLPSPPDVLIGREMMKELILTKLYNGATMTKYFPPFDHFFFRPREDSLKELVLKYPPNKKKFSQFMKTGGGFRLPDKASFQLKSGASSWDFYCDYNWQRKNWINVFDAVLKTYNSLPDFFEKSNALVVQQPNENDDESLFRTDVLSFADKKNPRKSKGSRSRNSSVKKEKVASSSPPPGGSQKKNIITMAQIAAMNKVDKLTEVVKKGSKGKVVLPIDFKELKREELEELQINLVKFNKPALLPCYVDVFNFSNGYFIESAEMKQKSLEICKKWFESDESLVDGVTPLLLPIEKFSSNMFESQLSDLQSILQKFYSIWMTAPPSSTPTNGNGKLSPRKLLSRTFDRSNLRGRNMKLNYIFLKFLKKLNLEDLFYLYVDLYNYREKIHYPRSINDVFKETLFKINTFQQKGLLATNLEIDQVNISSSSFNSVLSHIEEKLNNEYQFFMDIYHQIKDIDT